jgi:hypothetical protein
MIFSFEKKYRFLLASGLILAHLAAFFFAPWFHRHVEEDHVTVKDGSYHSHLPPFASHKSEHDQDRHDQNATTHLLDVRNLPLEAMRGALIAVYDSIINPAKFALYLDFVVPPSVSISPFFIKALFSAPPPRSPRAYSVFAASNLSPPHA